MRLFHFIRLVRQTRDTSVLWILVPLILIFVWIVQLPFNSAVQHATLCRFQMQTPSFWAWAVQQPIPAMYNCENSGCVTDGLADEKWSARRMVNHFPFRLLTFGDGRLAYLLDHRPKQFWLESAYQGHSIATRWRANPIDDRGYEVHLVEVVER